MEASQDVSHDEISVKDRVDRISVRVLHQAYTFL